MKKLLVLSVAAVLMIALAGCGSSNDKKTEYTPTGNEREIVITATNFQFDQEQYTVAKGETVKLVFDSAQGAHGVSIEDTDISLKKGQSAYFTADKAGTFDMECNVYCGGGHTEMKAQLVVE